MTNKQTTTGKRGGATAKQIEMSQPNCALRAVLAGLVCILTTALADVAHADEMSVYVTNVGDLSGRFDVLLEYGFDGVLQQEIDLPYGVGSGPAATDGTDIFIGIDNRIERYSRDGIFQEVTAVLPGSPTFSSFFFLHRDADGDFYAKLNDGSYHVQADGQVSSLPTIPEEYSVTGDGNGRVFMTSRTDLYTFDESGTLLDSQDSPFDFTGDLSVDPENETLFVLDQQGGVAFYDISTGIPALATTVEIPISLAAYSYFDPFSESLFVSGIGLVYQLSPEGNILQTYQDSDWYFNGGVVVLPHPNPEPSSAALLLIGALILMRSRSSLGRTH